MKTTTSFKQFDVVIVPFPFIDSEAVKLRPALVVSSEGFNNEAKMVTCLMITSSTSDCWTSDVEIAALRKAGLKKDCKVRFKVFSIQDHLIKGKAGSLDKKDQEQVKNSFRKVFI